MLDEAHANYNSNMTAYQDTWHDDNVEARSEISWYQFGIKIVPTYSVWSPASTTDLRRFKYSWVAFSGSAESMSFSETFKSASRMQVSR